MNTKRNYTGIELTGGELLETKFTSAVFASIVVILFFISIFNEDCKEIAKRYYIFKRTRAASIASTKLIAKYI